MVSTRASSPSGIPEVDPVRMASKEAETCGSQSPEGEGEAGRRLMVDPLDVVDGQDLGPLSHGDGQHVVGRARDCSERRGGRTGGTELERGPQGVGPRG